MSKHTAQRKTKGGQRVDRKTERGSLASKDIAPDIREPSSENPGEVLAFILILI